MKVPPFDTPPSPPARTSDPVARGVWCWPALLPGAAVVLDAVRPLQPGAGALGLLWLDLAAITCLVWATTGPKRARAGDWATPMDGRAVAGIVIALLHVIARSGVGAPMQWLHQFAAIGVCFYSLGARLRREPLAPDAVWPSFAMVSLALSAFTLAHVTGGIEALAAASADVDISWAGHAGTAKTLVLVTILCAGRAAEANARALWPVTVFVGALAVVLHGVSGGLGLGFSSLASLDEPFYFGTAVVLMMFMLGLARAAWLLVRERPAEAARWRATAVTFVVAVVMLIFGGTSGGEGVRTVLVLAAAATIASTFAPRSSALRAAVLGDGESAARKAA